MPPPGPAFLLHGLDPEMLRDAIRESRVEPCLLSATVSVSSLARLQCPSVALDFASLGPSLHFSGQMAEQCYTIIFVLDCPTPGHSLNFETEHTDGYIGFFPPGSLLDAATPSGYRNATLTIPADLFLAAVARQCPDLPESIFTRGAGMRVGPRAQARLRHQLATVKHALARDISSFSSRAALQLIERELLDVFLTALRDGCDDLVPPPPPRTGGRLRRMRQAREFITAHLHRPIYLDDLCAELGLTPRAVENLFRDLLGVSPITYLRHRRLHGARHALQRSSPRPGAVKQVALEWGHWHLGRFARDYRTLFGESPSETITRHS